MMINKEYVTFTTDEFVTDDDFMRWVLHPEEESELFWQKFLLHYPEKKKEVEEAAFIIQSFGVVEPQIPFQKLKYKRNNNDKISVLAISIIGRQLLKIAAIFLFIATLGTLYYYYQHKQVGFSIELSDQRYCENSVVILPDGTISEYESDETRIQQTASGKLAVNNDTLILNEDKMRKDASAMTQVIIPYGKRSEITLADGTRIWLNAGSTLSYPVRFSKNKREVYLLGEAFFEVTSDRSRPFYVITNDMKIRVTGTRFNVTSYQNDTFTQAVLVKGKIEASKNNLFGRSIELSPGERIVYSRNERVLHKDKVNTSLFSSWVDGYLVIENEPVDEIFKKLERFYNKRIVTEALIEKPRFTGKLNLADDLEKVLKNIAFSGSFTVETENGLYIIKQ